MNLQILSEQSEGDLFRFIIVCSDKLWYTSYMEKPESQAAYPLLSEGC